MVLGGLPRLVSHLLSQPTTRGVALRHSGVGSDA
jgi:hypothetical protein